MQKENYLEMVLAIVVAVTAYVVSVLVLCCAGGRSAIAMVVSVFVLVGDDGCGGRHCGLGVV